MRRNMVRFDGRMDGGPMTRRLGERSKWRSSFQDGRGARSRLGANCIMAGLAWLMAGAGTVVEAQPGQPPAVSVVEARAWQVPATIKVVGSIEPNTRSLIASEVAGIVEDVPVEEGDRLEKGALICQLRSTTRKLALEEAEARVNRLDKVLAELEAGTRQEDIDRAKAEMEEARALYEKWQKELERIEGLRSRGSAAQKEYNDAVGETAAARERLNRAKAAYQLAVAGPRKEVIAAARFAVEAERLAVAKLQYDFDQCSIEAPFTGYVTAKHAEVGEWINAGGPVVELIDLETVLVRVDVPESAIAGAHAAKASQAPVTIMVEALGETLRGVVEHVIPQADEKARTFPVELKLDNRSQELKSGMFVRAQVPSGPTVRSVIVPRDAILQRGLTHYVVTVGPGPPPAQGTFAMPVPVQLGADVGEWVAVESAMLFPGAKVAIKGHDRVYGPQPAKPTPVSFPEPEVGEPPATQAAAPTAATRSNGSESPES